MSARRAPTISLKALRRRTFIKGMRTTQYTLVWGFLMNESHRHAERFEGAEGRKAAWGRVQEVMSLRGCPRNYGPSHPVCLLQVYSTAPDGTRRCASFKPHVDGSQFIQWRDAHGQGWAVDAYEPGASCG